MVFFHLGGHMAALEAPGADFPYQAADLTIAGVALQALDQHLDDGFAPQRLGDGFGAAHAGSSAQWRANHARRSRPASMCRIPPSFPAGRARKSVVDPHLMQAAWARGGRRGGR